MNERKNKRGLKILKTEDPKSLFTNRNLTPEEILERLGRPRYLLSSSSKVEKSKSRGVLTRILYLTSGVFCSHSTKGCRSTCLGFSSGRMGFDQAATARDRRSALYIADRKAFLALLCQDLHQLCYDAETEGLTPMVRLNGASDLAWNWEFAGGGALEEFADRLIAYDYTKVVEKMNEFLSGSFGDPWMEPIPWPKNYKLTFSMSERNAHHAEKVLSSGGNVACVFWPDLPKTWLGYPVIDGDKDDLRYLDPSPAIVGLRAKGLARKDLTGFVVRTDRPTAGLELNRTNAA